MFVGPWDQGGEWNDKGLSGFSRWLNRIWNLVGEYKEVEPDAANTRDLRHQTHRTIKKATDDIERFHFNTMLASLMELTNYLGKALEAGRAEASAYRDAIDSLLLLLAPTTPHLAEELWTRLGHPYSIHNQPWPQYDPELAREEEVTLVIQVNGKLRDRVSVSASIPEAEARELALSRERVQAHLLGKTVAQVIFVPGRLVNVVAR
jgi:leucyl-tRNA synthetase